MGETVKDVITTTKGGCVPLVREVKVEGYICFGPDKKWQFIGKDKESFGYFQDWYGFNCVFKRPKGLNKKLFKAVCIRYAKGSWTVKDRLRAKLMQYCKNKGLSKRRYIDLGGE